MQLSGIPARFPKVWAVNAAGAYIRTVPVDSQIGIQDGAASFDTGFVPDNFTPVPAGGVPPFGQDFNGLLNVMTSWQQWGQAGGPVAYDGTFSTAVNGYPKGAVLASSIVQGAQWYSTADGNTTNPDDPLTSSGWARVGIPVGTPIPFFGEVPTGFVSMNGSAAPSTIGSGSSGATYANADALFLFVYNWTNSQLAIYTSGGVSTSRGANAVADFNANKRLAVPDGRGAGVIGVDNGSTNLNGVPVVAGNTTTPGSTLGENLHALSSGENGNHTHGNSLTDNQHRHNIANYPAQVGAGTSGGGLAFSSQTTQFTDFASSNITINNAASGSGTGHNTVQRSLAVKWGQKL